MGAAGLTARQRVDRYGEFVELLDLLLTQERTTWSGSWYTAVEARSAPGCVQQPRVPFVLAANGPRSMRLVASRGQGWVTTGPATAGDEQEWWAGVAELSDHLDDALSEAGKSRDSVERYLSLDSGPAFGLGRSSTSGTARGGPLIWVSTRSSSTGRGRPGCTRAGSRSWLRRRSC